MVEFLQGQVGNQPWKRALQNTPIYSSTQRQNLLDIWKGRMLVKISNFLIKCELASVWLPFSLSCEDMVVLGVQIAAFVFGEWGVIGLSLLLVD